MAERATPMRQAAPVRSAPSQGLARARAAATPARGCAAESAAVLSPAVRAAVNTPAESLNAEVRRVLEPGLGFDLSTVRVHTAGAAAWSAATVRARAYTVGRDIVFGAGQYAPGSAAGRALLAHELGHVRDSRSGPARLLRQPVEAPLVPPTVDDQRQTVEDSISFLGGAAEFYAIRLRAPRRRPQQEPQGVRVQLSRLGTQLAGWLRTRDTAAQLIDTALGAEQTLTERLRKAYRDAVTALLEAAALEGRRLNADAATGDSPHQLFQRYRAVIHEWAWPTTVADPQGTALLGGLSDDERARIRFGDQYQFTPALLDSLFHPRAVPVPSPPGTTVVLAPGGSPRIRAGLTRLAASLLTTFAPPMPVDTTATTALDLGRYGGDWAVYRFTHVQRSAPKGREMLVERVSSIAPDQRPPQQQQVPAEIFARLGFVRATATAGITDWSADQFTLLQSAIAQIPESMLATVRGMTFIRVPGANPADATLGASYSIEEHAIRVFDTAFGSPEPTFATPGGRASTAFDRLILHEVGHALDDAPVREPLATFRSSFAQQSRFHRTPIPGQPGTVTLPAAEKAPWAALLKRLKKEEATLTAGRTLSGRRQARNAAGLLDWTDVLPPGEANDFRTAAAADGLAGLTAYADTSIAENFAETFSFYIADPQSLSRLRPHLYAYFAARFPDPQRPPPTP
ncbi:eCIS core domain-containing protein [Actinoplanes sp. CA-051413]|uniref:eCIS core domain-containing protein n=1 Tax=Actinoplanes sp. CA-051413 TaxID=3239899 RepID=UPI003D98CBA9